MKEFFMRVFGLQFFADAGTNVNATETMTNAHTGETIARGDSNGMSEELKLFYNTEMLENVRPELVYAQFAMRTPLPKNHKGQVQWRKWNRFANAGKLQEGVIPAGQPFGMTTVYGSIDQYGTYTAITDKLELRAYDDIILGATEEMGASAAKTQEELIRDALYMGTNVMYCPKITVATGAFAADVTTEHGLVEDGRDGTYGCRLTPKTINDAVTIMKKNKAPRISGRYYAVVHPSVAHDLRESDDWIEAHKYGAPEELFNGEIGELHGMRFVENPDAPVLRGADLASDSRTLAINYGSGYSGAITSVAFDGGTVATNALKDRYVSINGVVVKITANTDSTLTFASTNFGSISDNTEIFPADYGANDIAAYPTYVFGKDAFAIIDPEGGALEMIAHDKSEIGGPLNQYSTIGYKFESNGATVLYPERLLRIMCTSVYSETDSATNQ